jgi:hypothetical protein
MVDAPPSFDGTASLPISRFGKKLSNPFIEIILSANF